MADFIAQFRDAIGAAGLTSPDRIEADGKIHRFPSNGKKGDDSGWYVLHGDGIPAGAFGCWRSSLSQSWRADIGRSLTPAEDAAHRSRVEAMRSEREAEATRRQSAARESAAMTWKESTPVGDHPYLKAKGIKAHRVRFRNGALVVPMNDCSGVLQSLQFIGAEGEKLFLPGGQVTGCYFAIGKAGSELVIAEGFATGAAIHEATGLTVAVAFSANNLEPVARALHGKYPDAHIVVAGDNDISGTGQRAAAEAAQAAGGAVAIPPQAGTDWNDVRLKSGNELVKSAIEAALLAEKNETSTGSLPTEEVRAIAKDVPSMDEFASVRTAGYVMTATTGPARFCVGNRVPQGLVIIGGRPKSRKSWWALQLAI